MTAACLTFGWGPVDLCHLPSQCIYRYSYAPSNAQPYASIVRSHGFRAYSRICLTCNQPPSHSPSIPSPQSRSYALLGTVLVLSAYIISHPQSICSNNHARLWAIDFSSPHPRVTGILLECPSLSTRVHYEISRIPSCPIFGIRVPPWITYVLCGRLNGTLLYVMVRYKPVSMCSNG